MAGLSTALLTAREFIAEERRSLLDDFCAHDLVTGQPILATMDAGSAEIIAEFDEMLAQIDEALIEAGIDPQPQPTNVVVLPVRSLRPVRAAPSDGWTGGSAA